MDMCEGAVMPKMLKFAVPLMLSSILQLLFNAADVVVVGKFAGDNALAAVGCTGSLINLLINLFMGLSVGANVMVARHFGAKQEDKLKKSVHTSMFISILGGILLTAVGVLFTEGILGLMETPEDVLPLAALYLRIYFMGMVPNMIYNFGSAILRAIGDTKRPMYFLTLAGIINVCLNLLFVICFEMGVAGVATATVIAQTISAVLVVICLMREKGAIRLILKDLKIDKKELLAILRIGLPAGMQGCIFSLSNVIIQKSVNGFGSITVSGNSAAANLEGFVYVSMNAFHQATISFMSQNYGAGRYDRLKKIVISGLLCATAVGMTFGNLEYFLGSTLLGIYTSSENVIAAGLVRMSIICTTYFLCGIMDVMVGVLRGVGYSFVPMIVSLCGVCGVRLTWLFTVFEMEEYHKVETVYISYPISWLFTFLIHLISYLVINKKMKNERKLLQLTQKAE
ncbi:MAG: MATE family efflux transporter [Lachnospiraceae bacterium]|nr:MATE family efflux transporter [Lachnospiraceae bacterium]